ncbi:MAG: hypothetical protein HY548_04150 [Elusimicrobia bacterium]|nr:hypothetical protein [Elusimicrobiota bacterium]
MGIKGWIESYIISKGVKRAAHSAAAGAFGLLATWLVNAKGAAVLAYLGVTAQVKDGVITMTMTQLSLEAGLVLLFGALFAFVTNFLKWKTGAKALQ